MPCRDLMCSYRFIDNGGDDKTHYMRKRGSHGAFKLYNKAKESNLAGIEKTRYEVTLKVNFPLKYISMYKVDYGVFPDIRFVNMSDCKQLEFDIKMDSTKISEVDLILAEACIDVPSRLKRLPYRKRKKIEVLIKDLYHLVSFSECKNIQDTINEYFSNLTK